MAIQPAESPRVSSITAEPVELQLEPRQARRHRWAGPLAEVICTLHVAAAVIVFGWYYWTVPKWKHELHDYGYDFTSEAKYLIHFSDCVVNYWYLQVPVAAIVLYVDFVATRWLARQIGLRFASVVGLCILFLILANMVIGQYYLIEARDEILKLISIQGRSPWARSSNP